MIPGGSNNDFFPWAPLSISNFTSFKFCQHRPLQCIFYFLAFLPSHFRQLLYLNCGWRYQNEGICVKNKNVSNCKSTLWVMVYHIQEKHWSHYMEMGVSYWEVLNTLKLTIVLKKKENILRFIVFPHG